uniref:hypothetical protein n=1 Tax=Pseudomonas viridiflava TaxID=33069 RepID=UPI0019D049A8
MFDSSLAELTGVSRDGLAGLVEANHAQLVERENEMLLLAAGWADWHDAMGGEEFSPLVERATVVGGPGTPAVEEFCCVEFGALQG